MARGQAEKAEPAAKDKAPNKKKDLAKAAVAEGALKKAARRATGRPTIPLGGPGSRALGGVVGTIVSRGGWRSNLIYIYIYI